MLGIQVKSIRLWGHRGCYFTVHLKWDSSGNSVPLLEQGTFVDAPMLTSTYPNPRGPAKSPTPFWVAFQSQRIAPFSEFTASASLPSSVSFHLFLLSHHPTQSLLTVSLDTQSCPLSWVSALGKEVEAFHLADHVLLVLWVFYGQGDQFAHCLKWNVVEQKGGSFS